MVHQIVCDTFDISYADRDIPRGTTDTKNSNSDKSEDESQVRTHYHAFLSDFLITIQGQDSKNIYDRLPSLIKPTPNHACDELDAYLTLDVEDVSDALGWWHNRCSTYPHLSRMALDYLLVPDT